MILNDFAQTFLFTFRNNGQPSVEVLVEQLADYDPSVTGDAYKSAWFGSEVALAPMLEELGFTAFDIQGVLGALRSHRGADRRLKVTPNQLNAAGFHVPIAA